MAHNQLTLWPEVYDDGAAGALAAIERLRARLRQLVPSEWWVQECWQALVRLAEGRAVQVSFGRRGRRGVGRMLGGMRRCTSCGRYVPPCYQVSSGACYDCYLAAVEEDGSLAMISAGIWSLAPEPGRVGSTFDARRAVRGAFVEPIVAGRPEPLPSHLSRSLTYTVFTE